MMKGDIAVSAEKAAFYRENGFVQFDNVLSAEELEELRAYADEAMAMNESQSQQPDKTNRGYYRVLNQRLNTWLDHTGMASYTMHSRFAGIANQLTGERGIRLFHDHLLYKMPGDSKPTPWHQDMPYWPMNETGALSIWLTLDDVTEENGCMMFMPGSHRVGKLEAIDLVNPQDIYEYEQGREMRSKQPVIVRMKAGSCTFHDGLTFHYAHSNRSKHPRRVLAVIYMIDGTTYSGKPHIVCDHVEGLSVGALLTGPHFPKLA